MARLSKINITSFQANESHPAYVSIGGTTTRVLPDGSSVEVRADAHTVGTDRFLEASRRLLQPALDEVIEGSHADLAAFLQRLDALRASAIEAHKEFAKATRNRFAAATGAANNHSLEGFTSNVGTPSVVTVNGQPLTT